LRRQFGVERGKLLAFQMNRLHTRTSVAVCCLLNRPSATGGIRHAALPNEDRLCPLIACRERL
jgi:hypothetical protein